MTGETPPQVGYLHCCRCDPCLSPLSSPYLKIVKQTNKQTNKWPRSVKSYIQEAVIPSRLY